MELLVFLKCSGVNIRLDNITDMVTSFVDKNKGVDYKFYVVADEDSVKRGIRAIFDSVAKEKLLSIRASVGSWAVDFNIFLEQHSGDSEWLLITHDDVEFITDDYFVSITKEVSHLKDKIGWITSTSEHYYKNLNKMVTDTFRIGFHKDRNRWGAMFQLHHNDFRRIDYPEKPVKIRGPMSALMITPMSSMKRIGYCEDWTPYTMLIDENWSLEALKNNLYNVWVPSVHHLHPNRIHKRKAFNRWEKEAHTGFLKKWGFKEGGAASAKDIEGLRRRWGHTLIPWSSYRNSYDWEFVDE